MKRKNLGIADVGIDIEKILIDGGMISELFHYQDIQRRKLFIDTDIEQFSVSDVIRHILQYNADDLGLPAEERDPILLYISSRGGEVDSGWSLINAIENSVTPVYTINIGYQYSMAFLIGIAGHKRFAMRDAKYLMHDGFSSIVNSATKIHDQMEFQKKIDQREKNYVLRRSKLSGDEYDTKLRVEWYMFADEAKEYGFVDYIIGEDCQLSDII